MAKHFCDFCSEALWGRAYVLLNQTISAWVFSLAWTYKFDGNRQSQWPTALVSWAVPHSLPHAGIMGHSLVRHDVQVTMTDLEAPLIRLGRCLSDHSVHSVSSQRCPNDGCWDDISSWSIMDRESCLWFMLLIRLAEMWRESCIWSLLIR